jgi:diacylglycerol kinase family enzyme
MRRPTSLHNAGRDDPLTVLLNPAAGASTRVAEHRLLQALSAAGLRGSVRVVRPEALAEAVRGEAHAGAVVAVAGGDGTLSTAAQVLAGSEAVLAPFPLGTRNHFARRLEIGSPSDAARAIARGRTLRIPVGSVAGRIFIHHASAGIYPRMVRIRERIRAWSGRRAGNVLAGAYVLVRLDARPVALHVGGERRERVVPGLWVGLGRRAFRLPVDGHLSADASLEVLIPEIRSRVRFVVSGLRALLLMKRGEPLQRAGLEVVSTERFTLESDGAVDISWDGEVERREPPLEFRVHPEALRVVSLLESDGVAV